jgi:hypothetical protein
MYLCTSYRTKIFRLTRPKKFFKKIKKSGGNLPGFFVSGLSRNHIATKIIKKLKPAKNIKKH